jgi:membrane protein implicated in regulation of membrane protease activity
VESYLVLIASVLGLELPRMSPMLEIVGLALVALLLFALVLDARQRRERERRRRERRRRRLETIVAQRLAEPDPEIPE